MQAKDEYGQWQYIETLEVDCHDFYQIKDLANDHFWTLTAPVYSGAITTRLRIELLYIDPTLAPQNRIALRSFDYRKKMLELMDGEKVVYSNEFDGAVNPAQFWKVQAGNYDYEYLLD